MTRFKTKLIVVACLLVLTGSRNNDLGIYPCSLGDQKRVDEILARTEKALRTNPNDLDEMFQRSYALFINGQIKEGLALCEKLMGLEKSFRTRDLHYRILKRTGDFEGSLADVSTFMFTEKEKAFLDTCQFTKATFLYRLNRPEEALKECEDVENDLSSDAELYYLKALCYNRLKDKVKELENIEKAIELAPAIGQYRLRRAILKFDDKTQCLRDLNLFCNVNSLNYTNENVRLECQFSYSKAAKLFLEMGEQQRALELCRMGLAQGEERYELWKTQAKALIETGKSKEAQKIIQKAEAWLDEQNAKLTTQKRVKS